MTRTLVQKFGGTSVADLDKIAHVADKIVATAKAGDQVVAVLSAMSGETDRLHALAEQVSPNPVPRELDVLLSTGEQVTIALMAMALAERGLAAKSYTGGQVCIRTDAVHSKARIRNVDESRMREDLAAGYVVVVAGFQGIDQDGNITTLGRGGSDTTAVALAAALQADECQIYTDVDGVYTADPRIVEDARLLHDLTFEEMLELASLGAKVLQPRSVELAGRHKVPLRVLNTFNSGNGTLIALEDKTMEQAVVSGITYNGNEAKLTILGVPDTPGIASTILCPIGDANIDVDMIIQNAARDGTTDFTFTVHRRDFAAAKAILEKIANELSAKEVRGDCQIAKVSLVGVGMKSHAGIACTMFKALASEGINIQMISTSEIKVSVVLDDKYLELAVRALHTAFELAESPGSNKVN